MGIQLGPASRMETLRERTPVVTTLCSHSSLQIFHGARLEGLGTLGLALGKPPRFYEAFPLARPDRFLSLSKLSEMGGHAASLRREGSVVIPTGSFVEYMGAEAFDALDVPVFGNRKVLGWESDREKEREWLEQAEVPMPRKFPDLDSVDGPVIIKYYGAKGGKGFFLAKSPKELGDFRPTGPYVIQEYVVGTRYYVHFFYSPLSEDGYRVRHGSIELLGMDRRDEANIDELYKLGAQERLRQAGIRPTFVVTGNVPVILRESLLPQVFDIAARIVDTSVDLFGGMVGPFCVEGIVTEDLRFKVFEISTRIVAGTNLFTSGSSYSDFIAPRLSTGRRIALELKRARAEDRLTEVLS
jgi:5-formaminoimidazole-4-carboxamide-1-(beta)-D-ribofuranosyl 5'-monophosphate synthetase